MRRIMLIATLVALGLAGTAYAATVVSNVYIIKASGKPVKSGTKARPKPAGLTVSYTVSTIPKGERPNVVKQLLVTIAGVQAHTNAFPTCSTSKLNAKGPSACPKGSLVGTGFEIVEVGLASSQSGKPLATCRVEVSVYNGGGNSLSYYVYANPAKQGECPSTGAFAVKPLAFPSGLKEKGTTLVQTINIPFAERHPNSNTTFDAAVIQSKLTIPAKSRKIKGKTVGFGETIACPANRKRHIAIKFTPEKGKAQSATANVACK
jgi:hypothetical protein